MLHLQVVSSQPCLHAGSVIHVQVAAFSEPDNCGLVSGGSQHDPLPHAAYAAVLHSEGVYSCPDSDGRFGYSAEGGMEEAQQLFLEVVVQVQERTPRCRQDDQVLHERHGGLQADELVAASPTYLSHIDHVDQEGVCKELSERKSFVQVLEDVPEDIPVDILEHVLVHVPVVVFVQILVEVLVHVLADVPVDILVHVPVEVRTDARLQLAAGAATAQNNTVQVDAVHVQYQDTAPGLASA